MQPPKGIPLRAFAIFLLAAVVGTAGGLLGSGFQKGLDWIQAALCGPGDELSSAVRNNLAWWQTLLVPTAGGFAAGCVLLLLRGRKPPFGIADLIAIVQLRKGTIRLRECAVQIVSSACTIGSGGSIGREGANSQIAATLATLVARWTRLGSRPRAVLIGCGVAAGMATSYNAPIAGALFVMEVVLGNFAMNVFAPIVVASVLATIVRKWLLGSYAIYNETAAFVTDLPWTLILATVLLGVLCGLGAMLFRTALTAGRNAFARLRLPPPLGMALGGLVVGAIGTFMPEAWGNGFEVIEIVAHGQPAIGVVLTLFVWKQVATVATVGSGGLGGIFTPNLVIGAAFGAMFAFLLRSVGAADDAQTATFVFVGMAGLTAATMHAPVTAVVLVFELTGHYELVLPVMLCSIVGSITASLIDEDSYYSAALRQKGEQLPGGIEDLAVRTTFVRDVLRRDCVTVRDTAPFAEVMALLGEHRGDTIYVVDGRAALVGRIELQDVKHFLNDPSLTAAVIAADLTRPVVTARADDSIAAVMPRFDDPELRELAVVGDAQPPRLLGRVRHQDVITTLGSEVLGQQRRSARVSLDGRAADEDLRLPPGYALHTLPVPDAWIGLSVDAVPEASPGGIVVVTVIRPEGGRTEHVAATPDLVLQDGWEVVVLATREAVQRLDQGVGEGPAEP
ncbi:MAG: chloride channel protein [Planctomycetes bacterium]|nr:chloride channel protein [Planctomycetota bacterium]